LLTWGDLNQVSELAANRYLQVVLRDDNRAAANVLFHLNLGALSDSESQRLNGYLVAKSPGHNQPLAVFSFA
jgi:hypothetical protein